MRDLLTGSNERAEAAPQSLIVIIQDFLEFSVPTRVEGPHEVEQLRWGDSLALPKVLTYAPRDLSRGLDGNVLVRYVVANRLQISRRADGKIPGKTRPSEVWCIFRQLSEGRSGVPEVELTLP